LLGVVGAGALLISCGGGEPNTQATAISTRPPGTPQPATPLPEPATLIAAAKAEGKLTLYPQLDASIAQAVQTAFQKEYPGIALELVLAPPAPPVTFLADLDKGTARADVVLFNDASLKAAIDRNALAKYVPLNTEWIASDLKEKDGLFIESVPAILSVAYNTTVAPKEQAPKTVEEVVDTRWKQSLACRTRAPTPT